MNHFLQALEPRHFLSGAVPAAPTGLMEVAETTSAITLGWTDNSPNESGFRVDRWDGRRWATVGKARANATRFTDTRLQAGQFYAYRVFAYDGAGLSRAAAFLGEAETLAPGAVAPPGSVAATYVTGSDIVVQFIDPSAADGADPVQVSVDGGAWANAGSAAPGGLFGEREFVFTSAAAGHAYSFRVAGSSGAGLSSYSAPVLAMAAAADTLPPVLGNGKYYTDQVVMVTDPVARRMDHQSRHNPSGTLDKSFGSNGTLTSSQSTDPGYGGISQLAGSPTGNVIVLSYGQTGAWPTQSIPFEAFVLHSASAPSGYLANVGTSFEGDITIPPTPVYAIRPDGSALVATNDVTASRLLGYGPQLHVLSPNMTRLWSLPIAALPDAVVGLPNGLIATLTGGSVALFDSYGNAVP